MRHEGLEILENVVQMLFRTSRERARIQDLFNVSFRTPRGGEKSPIKLNDRNHGLGMFSDQKIDLRSGFEGVQFPEIGIKIRSWGGFLVSLEMTRGRGVRREGSGNEGSPLRLVAHLQ